MPGRKKPCKGSRKNIPASKTEITPKEALKLKLRQKLEEKKLERTSDFSLDNRIDKLEESLEKAKTPEEKAELQARIEKLSEIQEKHANNIAGEFPEYADFGRSGEGSSFQE
jgi:hypothetical protein